MSRDFSFFDRRQYPTADVVEGYRQWAPLYDNMMPGHLDMPLLNAVEGVDFSSGPCVDLACGTGRIGRYLKEQRGVAVIDGVDVSPAMLAVAKPKGLYRTLLQNDVLQTGLTSSAYALGVCVLATCHVADLDGFYREARRLLKPGGALILVDFHPHFLLNGIPTHFPRGGDQGTLAIRNVVHLLSDHFQSAQRAGLTLADLRERVIDDAWVKDSPSMAAYLHKPVGFMLVLRAD